MKKDNVIHCIVCRLRKKGLKIDYRNRTIFYFADAPEAINNVGVERLCKYGFGRQALLFRE